MIMQVASELVWIIPDAFALYPAIRVSGGWIVKPPTRVILSRALGAAQVKRVGRRGAGEHKPREHGSEDTG